MDNRMVTVLSPKGEESEAYRILWANLKLTDVANHKKVIIFTSAGVSVNKTTLVCNLAVVMAKFNMKTLLIDADLRQQRVNELFGLGKTSGLTDYLLDAGDAGINFQKIKGYTSLDILSSGYETAETSELFCSDKMKQLLKVARDEYDVILMDATPVLSMSDTLVLSSLADAAVLVVTSNVSRSDEVNEAKRQLESMGISVLGAVLMIEKG